MNSTKIMLNIALSISIVSSSFLYCADTPVPQPFLNKLYNDISEITANPLVRYPLAGSVLFLGGSIYGLFRRESKPDAKPRHEWKKVIDTKLLTSKPNQYLQNLKYVFLDAWIGQRHKEKHMEVTKDHTIKQSESCRPFGFLGSLNSELATFKKSTDMVKDFATLAAGIGGVIYVANRPEIVLKAFDWLRGEKEKFKDNKTNKVDLSDESIDKLGNKIRLNMPPQKPIPDTPKPNGTENETKNYSSPTTKSNGKKPKNKR